MRRLDPKHIRIAGVVLVFIIVILLTGGYIAYSKRGAMLQKAINNAEIKAKKDYDLNLKIGSAHFTGLSTVSFADITIVPQQRDTILTVKKLDVSIKILPVIFGNVKLAGVNLQDAHFSLTDINHVKNFDFLFKKKKDTTQHTRVDLSELSYNLVNQVLYKIPDNLTLKDFLVSFTNDTSSFKLLAQTALIKNGHLTSSINVNDGAATWHFEGRMHPSDRDIDIKLYADGKKVEL